jgi:hypothetical protein
VAVEQVAVALVGRVDVGVAHALYDPLRLPAGRDEQACRRVAEVVEAEAVKLLGEGRRSRGSARDDAEAVPVAYAPLRGRRSPADGRTEDAPENRFCRMTWPFGVVTTSPSRGVARSRRC